jgi:hypothetical protein
MPAILAVAEVAEVSREVVAGWKPEGLQVH